MQVNHLLDYDNRHDPKKRYARHLIRNGKGIQAAEINEIQDAAHMRLKSVADALFSDGDIVSGCEIGVDLDTGVASLGWGTVYIDGEVHEIPAAEIFIPDDATVVAGVWMTGRVITELQDGGLRDPAVGTPNYQQPGAARWQIKTFWGLSTETHENGEFYELHTISERHVLHQKQPEQNTQITQATEVVQRYDYDANGHYVVEGLTVRALPSDEAGKQVYAVAEGKAHVMGREIVHPYAQRLVLDEQVSINEVEAEEHVFNPDSEGNMRIDLRHTPVEIVSMVKLTRERAVTLVHGSFSGARDPLPNESVVAVIQIKQESTIYTEGTDFRLINDAVDWSPSGNEPAPGSTYTVTYQYRLVVQPERPDANGFTVSNSVPGQLVQVRYSYRLPRFDILVIDRDGEITQVCGVPHRNSPVAPQLPSGTLRLATIYQRWQGLPEVSNDAIRVTSMKDLENIRQTIVDLYDLTARERMRQDAMLSAPTSARGLFVDAFTDDDMRDAGIPQTAAVARGELMLPIGAEVTDAANGITETLDYVHEVILEQTARTGSMKINPYQAQEPLPATVRLDPAVDRREEETTQWASGTTQRIISRINPNAHWVGSEFGLEAVIGSRQQVQVVGESKRAATTLRQQSVRIVGEGFVPNGAFTATFDGIKVATTPNKADADGNIDAAFTIPAGLPVGTKLMRVSGAGNVNGSASYTGSGTVTVETRRVVTTLLTERYDPLAQTFTLGANRHVSGVEVFFVKKGASEVRVQIRDTLVGLPNRNVLAEGRIPAASIKAGQVNRVLFGNPVVLAAGTEYALVVLTDTSDHEIAIAELGKWDLTRQRWLTTQAYQTGVMLSSSNAQTWTPHQTMDLWFRLLGARFTNGKKVISLGSVELENVTDLLPLAEVEYTDAASEATFVLKNAEGKEVARIQPDQTLSLTETLTGAYTLEVELTGTTNLSPVLYSGIQFIQGKLGGTADYVSRAFPCGANKKILVTLDTLQPGSSNAQVYVQTGTNAWTEATFKTALEIGDGWREKTFEIPCGAQETRVRILLTGDPSGRPRARALRAVVLDA